jgi:hypothetical protein
LRWHRLHSFPIAGKRFPIAAQALLRKRGQLQRQRLGGLDGLASGNHTIGQTDLQRLIGMAPAGR